MSRPQPPHRPHRQKVGGVQVALGVDEQVRSLFTLLTASLSFYFLGLQGLDNVGGVPGRPWS